MPSPPHVIHICTTCHKGPVDQPFPDGLLLHDAVVARFENWPQRNDFEVRGVACMNGCTRACTVAFSAPGKATYFFGDLKPEEAAAQILECAELYGRSTDGIMERKERPQTFRSGILARIPPI
jgi:predicted metal-binding protein